ncbi:MAG: hypothetical protein LH613_06005 [Chamaesiphon sp.]|nr:hypothetical protein [Chamaesiphon sp.]
MSSLIFGAITKVGTLLNRLYIKQFLPMILVGLMLLTTNVDPDLPSQATVDRLDAMMKQEDPQRPKTTAEWEQQARETKGQPVEKLKRIGEQSADAIKEFGGMYPEVAKRSAAELRDSTKTDN